MGIPEAIEAAEQKKQRNHEWRQKFKAMETPEQRAERLRAQNEKARLLRERDPEGWKAKQREAYLRWKAKKMAKQSIVVKDEVDED